MKRLLLAIALSVYGGSQASAQSLDDLNIQLHGYATQAFLYSNVNSWNTTDSQNGSASWTEAVVNLSAQPDSKLRIGMQGRYFLLGDYGNSIALDWAQADYKFNDRLGFRLGKVKTPTGLFNETQDIDPAHLWVLLPQGIYPITSRNATLVHYGVVVYGTVPLGESFGKLDYRGFAGQRILSPDDGYLQPFKAEGLTFPNGLSGRTAGGSLRWLTPVRGLLFGVSADVGSLAGAIVAGPYTGVAMASPLSPTPFFGKLERGRFMLAGEYVRTHLLVTAQAGPAPASVIRVDDRPWYLMTSFKINSKLTAGAYYSSFIDRQAPYNSYRYQKDWTLSARYDFNSFLYAKAEQHWIDGSAVGFSTADNPNIVPNSRLSLLKLGVSF